MFKRFWWMLLVMAPVGMMAGLMFAAVVTYVMPKKYESYAMIEIKTRTREPIESVPPAQGGVMTATVCGTEFEKIKSRNSLSKVIDSLDLINRWGVDYETALRTLKGIVQTESIKGTDLIQIRVRHTNKEEARDIAAEVSKTYKEYSDEVHSEAMVKGILELRKAVMESEDLVEETRNKLTITGKSKDMHLPEESMQEALERSMEKTDYINAQRDFEELKRKLITSEINQHLPDKFVVIREDPVIGESPVSPNVALNLVVGALGGLMLSPFLALPLMAFMNRKPVVAP